MSHEVDVVLIDKVESDYPRAGADNLIDPLAVSQDVDSLILGHHDLALLPCGLLISRHSHDEVDIWEELLCLLKDLGMTDMEHVEDTVSIDAGWPVCRLSNPIIHIFVIGNLDRNFFKVR